MAITRVSLSSLKTPFKSDSFLAGNTAYDPSTMELIATITGTGSSATLTFTSIPQTYQSLQVRGITKNTNSGNLNVYVDVKVNGAGGTSYANHDLYGDGSAVYASGAGSEATMNRLMRTLGGNVASIMAPVVIDFHDYASTSNNKTVRSFAGYDSNNTSGSDVRLGSAVYLSTANPISSISFTTGSGSWSTSTVLKLYGFRGA